MILETDQTRAMPSWHGADTARGGGRQGLLV